MSYPDRPADPAATILHWRDGGIAHIRFNRPAALNALDVPMTVAFHAACTAIEADAEVRVLVIAGEGRAFLAGGDVAAMAASPVEVGTALIREIHGAITLLNRLRCPVVAQVHGAAAGAAIGVLMASDLVVAAEGAKFSLAFPGIGASADSSSTWGLPRMMGLRQALRFALLGESVDAALALQMGLVSAVVAPDALAPTVQAWAEKIAASAPLALGAIKRLLRTSADHTLSEHLAVEAEAFLTCAATRDFAEGTAAFLAKRQPNFEGR
jgi:2-(1,2-epoxy-1,2-dihydrophenyl)acetyl-CoA isomerase